MYKRQRDLFGNDNPIHVEVGSGKGAFVSGMAKQNPDINYIGIDIQKSVLSYALDKVLEVGVPNIKLLWVEMCIRDRYLPILFYGTLVRHWFIFLIVKRAS